jgi:hypothetical protein
LALVEEKARVAGFTTLGLGCEGIVAGHEEKINALQGEAWELWVDLNYRLGQDPALRGAADHLLHIGRSASAKIGSEAGPTGPSKCRNLVTLHPSRRITIGK